MAFADSIRRLVLHFFLCGGFTKRTFVVWVGLVPRSRVSLMAGGRFW